MKNQKISASISARAYPHLSQEYVDAEQETDDKNDSDSDTLSESSEMSFNNQKSNRVNPKKKSKKAQPSTQDNSALTSINNPKKSSQMTKAQRGSKKHHENTSGLSDFEQKKVRKSQNPIGRVKIMAKKSKTSKPLENKI